MLKVGDAGQRCGIVIIKKHFNNVLGLLYSAYRQEKAAVH